MRKLLFVGLGTAMVILGICSMVLDNDYQTGTLQMILGNILFIHDDNMDIKEKLK